MVSFFGKSQYSSVGYKGDLIDGYPGRRVFHTSLIDDPDVDEELLVRYIIVKCNIIWFVHLTAPIFHPLEESFSSFSHRSSLSFVLKSDYCILKISCLKIKLILFYEF